MDNKAKNRKELIEKRKKNWKDEFLDATTGTGKKTQGLLGAPFVVKNEGDLEKINNEIKFGLDQIDRIISTVKKKEKEYSELQKTIIQKLIFIKDNKKRLLDKKNFIDYLEKDKRAIKLLDNFLHN